MISDAMFATAAVLCVMAAVFAVACVETRGAQLEFRRAWAFWSFLAACVMAIAAAWVAALS